MCSSGRQTAVLDLPACRLTPPHPAQLRELDARWMKEQPAEHRAVRISAVHALLPALEDSYQRRLAGGAPGSADKKKASRSGGRVAAGSGGGQAAGGAGAATSRKPRGSGKAAVAAAAGAADGAAAGGELGTSRRSADVLRELQALMAEEAASRLPVQPPPPSQQVQQPQQQQRVVGASGRTDGDITRFMPQRKPAGEAPPAALQPAVAAAAAAVVAPKRKPSGAAAAAAAGGGGYGLVGTSNAASSSVRQALGRPQADAHLPASAAGARSLLDRVMGLPVQQSQQQQKVQRPPPPQQASPQKRQRSPQASPAGPAGAAGVEDGSPLGSPGFEIVLSSPESPQQPLQRLGSSRVRPREESISPPPLSQRMLQAAQRMQQAAAVQLEQQQQAQLEQPPAEQPQPVGEGRRFSGPSRGPMRGAGAGSHARRASHGSAGAPAAAAAPARMAAAGAGDVVDLTELDAPAHTPAPEPAAPVEQRQAGRRAPVVQVGSPTIDLTCDSD